MGCNKKTCECDFNIKTLGICDVSKLNMNGCKKENLNWTEISIPEILPIPRLKPDIENIDQVYASATITSVKLIETPFAYKSYNLYISLDILNRIEIILDEFLETNIQTTINTLIGGINDLISTIKDAIPLIPGLGEIINPLLAKLQRLLDLVQPSVNSLLFDIDDLLNTIQTDIARIVCESLNSIICRADDLIRLLKSIQIVINDIFETVSTLEGPLIEILITTLQTIINNIITPSFDILIGENGVLIVLVESLSRIPIDCENTSAFTILQNAEGTCLNGRKLIVNGLLKQKIVYTALVDEQSVHSAHYEVPFLAYIIPYAKFECLTYEEGIVISPPGKPIVTINGYRYNPKLDIEVDLCEEFIVDSCIEDIYVNDLDKRTIFKNITLFLKAQLKSLCN
ncbi:hypothetical protein KGF45_08435 [Clostridioides sp. ZZV14-6154]|uniref:hypothetical protein n=1 Tax=unclassified Clostridioides TaxID=2635829 RepID=UPI001D10D9F5|nr:hypothetical protein [Clostridioides sp. ZZV14-6154]MCC0667492.1 hypothetical protein [Clostridioides sp. ZZV14-6153]MCC0728846.1 hypothetical protein [Clostridioides sp. ZZV14-6045]MCC0732923.1 hypothetical protein [Clostridioides sp. ZZV14-6048]MCC0733396.1 hypothetical protein [Clostridioides sp. ZZV14-6009]MCC0737070.1 hypothetical protein [Clostridioides sp. ZZV14-5902]WLD28687.1 hypothetical protein CDIFMA2_25710 [Clostridioides difficile]